MRFIRNFIIVFALFLSLAAAFPAHAVDSLFSVSGCSDDPTVPCQTTGDGVNTIISLNQTVVQVANTIDALLHTTVALKWAGALFPHDNTYRNGNTKLDAFANQIQTASDNELNPVELQSNEQHDETTKSASMTSRICVVDPKTGKIMKDAVSETTIITADQPWLRAQGEGSRRLSSFTTGYTQESQNYRLPNITIKQDAALPCGPQVTGQEKTQKPNPSQGENSYGSGAGNALLNIIYSFAQGIISILPNGSASGTLTATANIVGTAQNPFAGQADALTAGCATSSDLTSVSYASDEQKQKLCAAGGFVNAMYRPNAIDPTFKSDLNANDSNQQWDQNITESQSGSGNSNAFAARIEAAGDYMNCTLMPAGTQSPECNQNWANPTTPGNGTVCEVAKAYNIPCCQLQGVMELETGSGAYMGNQSCTRNNRMFNCCHGDVCGPAQVPCNQYAAFAAGENIDMCTQEGAAVLLSRSMLLKLCQADGKCDSYDWTKWGDYVKQHYSVPDGDYTATAYFYGLAHGCTTSACSQYRWGPGKGYCDGVASYCTTGQILPDKTSPQFCADCNKELERAHQTPITCSQ